MVKGSALLRSLTPKNKRVLCPAQYPLNPAAKIKEKGNVVKNGWFLD